MKNGNRGWTRTGFAMLLLASLAGCSDNATTGTIAFADTHGDGISGKFKHNNNDI